MAILKKKLLTEHDVDVDQDDELWKQLRLVGMRIFFLINCTIFTYVTIALLTVPYPWMMEMLVSLPILGYHIVHTLAIHHINLFFTYWPLILTVNIAFMTGLIAAYSLHAIFRPPFRIRQELSHSEKGILQLEDYADCRHGNEVLKIIWLKAFLSATDGTNFRLRALDEDYHRFLESYSEQKKAAFEKRPVGFVGQLIYRTKNEKGMFLIRLWIKELLLLLFTRPFRLLLFLIELPHEACHAIYERESLPKWTAVVANLFYGFVKSIEIFLQALSWLTDPIGDLFAFLPRVLDLYIDGYTRLYIDEKPEERVWRLPLSKRLMQVFSIIGTGVFGSITLFGLLLVIPDITGVVTLIPWFSHFIMNATAVTATVFPAWFIPIMIIVTFWLTMLSVHCFFRPPGRNRSDAERAYHEPYMQYRSDGSFGDTLKTLCGRALLRASDGVAFRFRDLDKKGEHKYHFIEEIIDNEVHGGFAHQTVGRSNQTSGVKAFNYFLKESLFLLFTRPVRFLRFGLAALYEGWEFLFHHKEGVTADYCPRIVNHIMMDIGHMVYLLIDVPLRGLQWIFDPIGHLLSALPRIIDIKVDQKTEWYRSSYKKMSDDIVNLEFDSFEGNPLSQNHENEYKEPVNLTGTETGDTIRSDRPLIDSDDEHSEFNQSTIGRWASMWMSN